MSTLAALLRDPLARSLLLSGGAAVSVRAALEFLHPRLRPGERQCRWCDAAFVPHEKHSERSEYCSLSCGSAATQAKVYGQGERPTPAKWLRPGGGGR